MNQFKFTRGQVRQVKNQKRQIPQPANKSTLSFGERLGTLLSVCVICIVFWSCMYVMYGVVAKKLGL